jgi:hypothetical protein
MRMTYEDKPLKGDDFCKHMRVRHYVIANELPIVVIERERDYPRVYFRRVVIDFNQTDDVEIQIQNKQYP